MDLDVIVVGAGPTGLVLAGELAMRGVAVAVVERLDEPSGQSRGGGVNPRTCEVLHMRGLLDEMSARALPQEGGGGHFAGIPVPLDTAPWRTRWPTGMAVPQDRIEAVLEQRLRALGVTVRRGTALVDVDIDGDAVTATVEGPSGGAALRTRFLVACDGGHSAVRTLTGTPFPGRAGTMAAVTADVVLAGRGPTVPRRLGHISELTHRGGGYWMMSHPLGDGDDPTTPYRVVFGHSGPAPERGDPVTPDEVAAALTAVHGPGTTLARLRWGTRFSDAARQVEHYRAGPLLFAGDAAHIHAPIGGQGLNLGVQDAVNLGWKLAAHLGGHPDVLDTYHDERHPVGAQVIATARAQSLLMSPAPDADDALALRGIVTDLLRLPDANRHIAGLMSGLALRYDLGDDHPLVGARLPDLSVDFGEGPTTVADLQRSGRGMLVEVGGSPGVQEVAPGVDRVGVRILDSRVGRDLDATRVLVRPDGHVAWVDDGGGSLDGALRRWFGVSVAAHVG